MLLCILSPTLRAQTASEIKITVTDSVTQTAIPGVNIAIKGTSRGATSDANGLVKLNASPNETIVISFIGYDKKELLIGNRTTLTVQLSPSQESLNEVVVVGYGVQKKVNMTGAVSTIDKKVIENRPVSNLASSLQGTTPGLIVTRSSGQPGAENITIQLRGATSANGNVNPLVMIDGVSAPISVLQTINPNDVENISVLKDAAAAAIYGAQAAGGVILVTTKKGKSGKTVFDYSTMIGTSWMQDVPQRMSLLDEALYANLSNKGAGLGPAYSDATLDLIRKGVEYYLNPADTSRYIYLNQKDLVSQTVRKRTGLQSHNFTARGGSEKVNYLASLGYYNQQGAFKLGPDKLNRYNARINVGAQLTKHISLDSRVAYTMQKQEAPSRSAATILNQTMRYRSMWPIFTPEGRLSGEGTGSANMGYAYLKEGGYDNTDNNNFDGVFTLKVADIVKGLQLRAVYGAQYIRGDRELFNRTVTTWQRFVPIYYLNNPNSFEVTRSVTKNNNVQFLADYDFNLGKKSNFHILGGYQYEDSYYSSVFTSSSNLVSNDLPALGLGDDATKKNSQTISSYAYQSYFGRLNYNYADKYLFEATVRVDESSRLAPGLRTKAFPAVSAGWNVNHENWFPATTPVSALKLRASWGQLGSALASIIGNYDYLNMLTRSNALVLGTPETRSMYFYQNTVPSSSLTWETVETSNGGIDLGLFKNKLMITADYYVKYNRNMLTPLQLPATFGVNTPRINNGELKSWGWELEVNYRDKVGKDFDYNIGFNLFDNKNKLLKYNGQKVITPGIIDILEGYPLKSIWGYKTDGYFQTNAEVQEWAFQNVLTAAGDVKYIDVNGDKLINGGKATPEDHGDLVYLGTDQPRYTFGITGGFNWKGFDFSFFFQGVGSRTFYPSAGFVNPQDAAWNQPLAFHNDYWTEDNRDAYFPRPFIGGGHNYLRADKWIVNGKYIRLKNAQIGYNLPESLLKKVKVSRARVFFTGQDLFTFTGLGIFDGSFSPEYTNNTSFQYPLYSNASLGINLTF